MFSYLLYCPLFAKAARVYLRAVVHLAMSSALGELEKNKE